MCTNQASELAQNSELFASNAAQQEDARDQAPLASGNQLVPFDDPAVNLAANTAATLPQEDQHVAPESLDIDTKNDDNLGCENR